MKQYEAVQDATLKKKDQATYLVAMLSYNC